MEQTHGSRVCLKWLSSYRCWWFTRSWPDLRRTSWPSANPNSAFALFLVSQQISSHQEQFIQMLNEPVQEAGQGGSGGGGGVAEAGGMNYIQVTPQEKEAIERVKLLNFQFKCTIWAPLNQIKESKIKSESNQIYTNKNNLSKQNKAMSCGTSKHVLLSMCICVALDLCALTTHEL